MKRKLERKVDKSARDKKLVLTQPEQPRDHWRQAHFDLEVQLSRMSTLDPFAAPPSTNEPFYSICFWQTLERGRIPFEAPDPIAYEGELNEDWHRFLCGPLQPFNAACGLFPPSSPEGAPPWALQAAAECLKRLNCDAKRSRSYLAGWCIGFGIEVAKLLTIWEVRLSECAKLPIELKRHFFVRAADATERDINISLGFLNGFSDGLTAARDVDHQSVSFKRCLYIALHWPALGGLSRIAVSKQLVERRLSTPSEERQVLQFLSKLGVPRRKNDNFPNP